MLNGPFSPWPTFSDEEIAEVVKVLASGKVNYWTGSECKKFEDEFATWCGVKHAVSLANGTVALDCALYALGLNIGDEVIVTPRTFIASVSSVVNAGAVPIFADVDPDSGNISAETIKAVLTTRTRAIVCVHLGGWPCDMDPIMELSRTFGLKVIEDCSQAHGAKYKGCSVGAIGHIGTWSFCQDKIMTTGGEGGMITTNDRTAWKMIWEYKDHGKSYDVVHANTKRSGFTWPHEGFGTNYRMLEVQGVIGRKQLTNMHSWNQARNLNANQIFKCLREITKKNNVLRVPDFESLCPESTHAYYKLYFYLNPEMLGAGWTRDLIIEDIVNYGVPCFQGSCSEVYLEKAFIKHGLAPVERLPEAKRLGETSLMLLIHPTLTQKEIRKTCNVLKQVLNKAGKKR